MTDSHLITLEQIRLDAEADEDYQNLLKQIVNGFPNKHAEVDPKLREFREVCSQLSLHDGTLT